MPRRVFFSFHYQRDNWRVSQIRNSWVVRPDGEAQGFYDRAEWEKIKRNGQEAVKRWINDQLSGASVTVVLIGAETATRPWVKYEIQKSYELKKGLLGIRIHNMRDSNVRTDSPGADPFVAAGIQQYVGGVSYGQSTNYEIFDWVLQNGYENMGKWIEAAAKRVNR